MSTLITTSRDRLALILTAARGSVARVLTVAFWRAAGARAARTVLVAAVPLVAPLLTGEQDAIAQTLLGLAFAAVYSLATSLANLPELAAGARSRWWATLDRVARTFGQTLAAALTAAAVWSVVDWPLVLTQALAAALVTAITAAVEQLPETVPLVEAEEIDGVHVITAVVDTSAPEGYEVPEVSDAKSEVSEAVRDLLEYHLDDVEAVYQTPRDPIHEGDTIVEKLLELGWRPTA